MARAQPANDLPARVPGLRALSLRLLAGVCLLLAPLAQARSAEPVLPGPLVTVQWLEAHADALNLLSVQEDPARYSAAPQFAQKGAYRVLTQAGGHVPGALRLPYARVRRQQRVNDRDVDWMLPTADDFQALLREVGVRADRPTVIITDGLSASDLDMGARVYWSMKVYGDDRVALLDGGLAGWIEAGKPVTLDAPPETPGNWQAGSLRHEWLADSDAVENARVHGGQIVDARPLAFHLGLERMPAVKRAGHIEGARALPPELRAQTRRGALHFLSASQYRDVLAHLDIDPQQPSVVYCNTGQQAAGAWFVLSQLVGNPQVRLYDASMAGWTAEDRPVVGVR